MGSIFQSQFVGNEFQPAVGADIPRPDNDFGLFEPAPLSKIDTGPIDLFAPGNINRLVLTSDPVSPTSNTSGAGASAPLDLFDIGSAGPVESINAGTTTPGAMADMARGFLGDVVSQGPVPAAISNIAGIAGPETKGVARGFGRLGTGLGLLGFPGIGVPLGVLQIGRGLFDVVESVIPGIRDDINNLTFDTFGFDLFGQRDAIKQALLEDPFGFADFSGFDPDIRAAEQAAAGFETSVSGTSGFSDIDAAEATASGFETGVGDPDGGGASGGSAGGTGSGGDTGGADSEGEGEAESGGGDSDF